MTRPSEDFDDPIRTIGHDATSTFDDTASNPTEHASSEAQDSATDVEGEADPITASDNAIEPEGLDATNDAEDEVTGEADEEAPIDGEYLSNPAASTGSTTDLDADSLEQDKHTADLDDDEDDEDLDDEDDDEDLDEDEDLDDEEPAATPALKTDSAAPTDTDLVEDEDDEDLDDDDDLDEDEEDEDLDDEAGTQTSAGKDKPTPDTIN